MGRYHKSLYIFFCFAAMAVTVILYMNDSRDRRSQLEHKEYADGLISFNIDTCIVKNNRAQLSGWVAATNGELLSQVYILDKSSSHQLNTQSSRGFDVAKVKNLNPASTIRFSAAGELSGRSGSVNILAESVNGKIYGIDYDCKA